MIQRGSYGYNELKSLIPTSAFENKADVDWREDTLKAQPFRKTRIYKMIINYYCKICTDANTDN